MLYDDLPATRALALHRAVAEAFEALCAAELNLHAAELAHHFAMAAPAGTAVEAVRYATRAAERARDQLAYEESVRFFTTALGAQEMQADAVAGTRCELLLALGDAQTSAGDTAADDRIGAQPWSAHAKADLARVLFDRDVPGDREAADGLLREALTTHKELGMTVAADKVIAKLR